MNSNLIPKEAIPLFLEFSPIPEHLKIRLRAILKSPLWFLG